MINVNNFFSLIDIEKEEKNSAKEYIRLRGLQEHIRMAEWLSSFLSDRKPTYKEVATAFRYDKRIRRIIYKYIGLLEEYYRAYLCNTFNKPSELNIKTNKSLYEYISASHFGTLVKFIWSLKEKHKKIIFENKQILWKNLNALVTFRNAVSHNRTIINYRDFEEVTLKSGQISNSLMANIRNLLYLLPTAISKNCKQEIINAAKEGEKKLNNQVEWKVIDSIILSFEKN